MSDPINLDDLDWQEWRHSDEVRVRYRPLSDKPGCHVGIALEELPPGCRTGAAHYHMKEEEHILVIDGAMELRLGDERYQLKPGDYVGFAAGEEKAHTLVNQSEQPCHFLIIGERCSDDVIVYPDSGKVQVRLLGEVYKRSPVDYWEGEE
jgi:uncharacterized cupin superfamily protein